MTIDSTLIERGDRYGDFTGHAEIAENLIYCMTNSRSLRASGNSTCGWDRLSPVQRQALRVIADKIARILNGDPNYDDNWLDIAGYATLVLQRLPDAKET